MLGQAAADRNGDPEAPDTDKKVLKTRATELSDGDWAGVAVRKAIAEVQAAVMVAVMTPVIVSPSTN